MNLPNRLTIFRIVFVPVVAALIMYPIVPDVWVINRWLIAGLAFGLAAITDAFDGSIARKRGITTDFGKLLDPVADKLLVAGSLIALMMVGLCSPWIIIIVLFREFLVTSMRMIQAGRGNIIPANNWGKAKTVIQIVAIVTVFVTQYIKYIIAHFKIGVPDIVPQIGDIAAQALLWISAVVTLISGAVYLFQSREIFKKG